MSDTSGWFILSAIANVFLTLQIQNAQGVVNPALSEYYSTFRLFTGFSLAILETDSDQCNGCCG
jgi:hypothetical protein